MTLTAREKEHVHALSLLTLTPDPAEEALRHVASLSKEERQQLLSLADSHHVVLRALEPLQKLAANAGNTDLANWAAGCIEAEHARIANALKHLSNICRELEAAGCPVVVMKSLDHWPDVGNDLDLYTTADDDAVVRVLTTKFNANVEPRSWGDRLAHKWNYAVPGLPELIEVHARRLGQTGEHIAMAKRFITCRMPEQFAGYTFMLPAPEERIIVATLQRMYRHFYFRVCDILNSARMVESGTINYDELRRSADLGGIWPGVASYLRIVSEYVKRYRGHGVPLPPEVLAAAPFGAERLHVRTKFIRLPLMPEGAELYRRQVTTTALRGDVAATFRLGLLPPLAGVAAVAYKITGSDKGIW